MVNVKNTFHLFNILGSTGKKFKPLLGNIIHPKKDGHF